MNPSPQPQSDLSSILQTLSAYAPPPPLQQQHPQLYHPPLPPHHPLPDPDHEEGEIAEEEDYDPATSLAYQLPPPAPLPQPHLNPPNLSHSATSSDPHAQPQPTPSSLTSKPFHPPSTSHITSYPLALRHITTHLLPHPHFSPRIRHLLHEQHKHEREWHRDRLKLVQQLGAREESRRKLDAVLASVGAATKLRDDDGNGKGGGQRAELSEEQELRLFDRKVWKAQKEMVGAAEKELGRLGVPFFGVGGENGEGLGQGELRELRGKVLGLLEDLCGEDEVG